mmetsp:Transcript_31155/g.75976  ORF Transcript_31155/g.75976 Transcript_31155/m.75976 type:complete len:216 (-) Transcript_31155:1012-1659(-)
MGLQEGKLGVAWGLRRFLCWRDGDLCKVLPRLARGDAAQLPDHMRVGVSYVRSLPVESKADVVHFAKACDRGEAVLVPPHPRSRDRGHLASSVIKQTKSSHGEVMPVCDPQLPFVLGVDFDPVGSGEHCHAPWPIAMPGHTAPSDSGDRIPSFWIESVDRMVPHPRGEVDRPVSPPHCHPAEVVHTNPLVVPPVAQDLRRFSVRDDLAVRQNLPD